MVTSTNSANSIGTEPQTRAPSIGRELWAEKGYLREAVIAGILANLMALVLPLFVMTFVRPSFAKRGVQFALGFGDRAVIAALVDISLHALLVLLLPSWLPDRSAIKFATVTGCCAYSRSQSAKAARRNQCRFP